MQLSLRRENKVPRGWNSNFGGGARYLSTNSPSLSIYKRYSMYHLARCIEEVLRVYQSDSRGISHLHILTAKKRSIMMKVKTAAGLDYVQTKIHHFNCPQTTKSQRNRYLICKPSTLKFNERHKKVLAQLSKPHAAAAIAKMELEQLAPYIHLKFGHMNMEYVREMVRAGHIKGLPQNIPDLKFFCPLCKIANATKLPRGGPVDHSKVPKGAMFHADFIIINVVSIRGFKSALLITEVCTRRKYGFPTRSRSPPLAIFRYFVNHMRKMGFRPLNCE